MQDDSRRAQMLQAALDVIAERGFPETRIADVAARAEVSPALVIYYFKTKNQLLADALRYAEDNWYAEGARRMAELDTAAERLEAVVAMSCLDEAASPVEESWSIWIDLWAAALRHPDVRLVREQFDARWREVLREIVRDGQERGEFAPVDPDEFAVAFSAMLDGLAVQIALEDPAVGPRRAFELSMRVAASVLGFSWGSPQKRGRRAQSARR